MKEEICLIEDPAAMKVGLEGTRNQILELLRVKEMTISQIAEALSKDQSTIYRHVKKLEDAGFIEVKGERKQHHIPEKIYGRKAKWFLLTPEPLGDEAPFALGMDWNEERIRRCLEILEEMGFPSENKEEVVQKLNDLLGELESDITQSMIDSLDENIDIDFFSLLHIKFLAEILKLKHEDELNDEFKEVISAFEL
ncbi:MAG: ArsR family transcriptional regulator [Candidatus Thermoplasmatota archaeon]